MTDCAMIGAALRGASLVALSAIVIFSEVMLTGVNLKEGWGVRVMSTCNRNRIGVLVDG